MTRFFIYLSYFSLLLGMSLSPVSAQTSSPGYTVIINQVRGEACCSPGTFSAFDQQTSQLAAAQLPATFALRYDVLTDQKYLDSIDQNSLFEYAAFLEIIPTLATDAQVDYHGSEEFWYEAQAAYLIGYAQADRQKLIDTYMAKFRQIFGHYPSTTVAWMIDSWSLRYLKEKYEVQVHQLTREQYGTDSYALYGGPPHYPYWPTPNWALIPSAEVNPEMPLIVRQTITDPVHNYGDTTNSYTSQPNDYLGRAGATFEYFKHLFYQAHDQSLNDYTFALIGLENSMAPKYQDEFGRQLKEVGQWEKSAESNRVVTAQAFAQWLGQQSQTWPQLYHGRDQELGDASQAWWITTPAYRARLRVDAKELYLSDLRIYHQAFTDPYDDYAAQNLGWWIVPFVLDGSRFFYNNPQPEFTDLARDNLLNRKAKYWEPTRLQLITDFDQATTKFEQGTLRILDKQDRVVAKFDQERFALTESATHLTSHPLLEGVIAGLAWQSANQPLWGVQGYSPFYLGNEQELDQERLQHYPLLFPEVIARPIDQLYTHVLASNPYALAGRNPVRLVLFPRDQSNFPTQITTDPTVTTSHDIDSITIKRQHGNNGMVFIDLENEQPLTTEATITLDEFATSVPIYFAPNCKQKIGYCLTHPRHGWWYLKSLLNDRARQAEEKNSAA